MLTSRRWPLISGRTATLDISMLRITGREQSLDRTTFSWIRRGVVFSTASFTPCEARTGTNEDIWRVTNASTMTTFSAQPGTVLERKIFMNRVGTFAAAH